MDRCLSPGNKVSNAATLEPLKCAETCWIARSLLCTAAWNVLAKAVFYCELLSAREEAMNGLIYLIGLIVVILFILSFLGLR